MKMFHIFFCCLVVTLLTGNAYAQRTISEGTLTYKIAVSDNTNNPQLSESFKGASYVLMLKGGMSRTDMVTNLGCESVIHNTKDGSAFILRDYSGQRLMITLSKENWLERSHKYEGMSQEESKETVTIAGYTCNKVRLMPKDGSSLVVYYTRDWQLNNRAYNPAFKGLPGLPVQYEFTKGTVSFVYTLASIDYTMVPATRFEKPKSGYRVMPYDEKQAGQ